MTFSSTRVLSLVIHVLCWKSCHASMFDLSWLVDTSPATANNVVDCEVRTILFDEGNNRHSKQRKCISYADEGGDASREMVYDIPQWLAEKYSTEFDRQRSASYLHIVGGHLSRGHIPQRQQLRYNNHQNGEDKVIVDSNAQVEISDSPFEFTSNNNHGDQRRTASSETGSPLVGVSSVLVVRVTTNDASVDLDAATISERIFGSFATPASQFKACSMGKKQLAPASGPNIVNGVLELIVNDNIDGVVVHDIENTINAALREKVGGALNSYDHVVTCLPKGSTSRSGGSWKAYAYADWNRSFFNNQNCGYLSTVIHELGHNMGLGHAGKGYNGYDDRSGIMGYGYNEVHWPIMCFNGAMNHQLGWYSDKEVDLSDRLSCGPWKGRLYGYADYDSSGISSSGVVIIKVNEIFVQFNKISDINIDTIDKRDVIAITRGTGAFASNTKSFAGLTSGTWQSGDDVVEICGSNTENGLEFYDIVVRHISQESICGQGYSLRGCDEDTSLPSISPTPLPTPFPTPLPTPVPTLIAAIETQVTMGPQLTSRPTLAPATFTPSGFPSDLPSEVPSDSPTSAPSISSTETMSPSSSPTIDMVCDDHEEEVFIFTDEFQDEHEKRCDWLRARPQIKAKVCVPGHRAYDVCEESCGKCSDNCHDSPDDTFLHQGVDRPCSWLLLRWTLAKELCSQPDNLAISVCPETCGACEHLQTGNSTTQSP